MKAFLLLHFIFHILGNSICTSWEIQFSSANPIPPSIVLAMYCYWRHNTYCEPGKLEFKRKKRKLCKCCLYLTNDILNHLFLNLKCSHRWFHLLRQQFPIYIFHWIDSHTLIFYWFKHNYFHLLICWIGS